MLVAVVSLTACASVDAQNSHFCPEPPDYSDDTWDQALKELERVPNHGAVQMMIHDLMDLQEKLDACHD
jgi:hypothetical protein